jgi:hypothetical protein
MVAPDQVNVECISAGTVLSLREWLKGTSDLRM